MIAFRRTALGQRILAFRDARDGAVVVEFALISTVLITLFAASLDLSYMIGAKRDSERASALMVRTLSSCPPQGSGVAATWKGTDCVKNTIDLLNARVSNLIVTFPDATFGAVPFQRKSGAIKMCAGTMTYLETDMLASALSTLKDDDVGALVYLKVPYYPFLNQSISTFALGATSNPDTSTTTYRQYSIDVQGNGKNFFCASGTSN